MTYIIIIISIIYVCVCVVHLNISAAIKHLVVFTQTLLRFLETKDLFYIYIAYNNPMHPIKGNTYNEIKINIDPSNMADGLP